MSLQTADYDYELPDELIARYPAKRREDSRLMLIERDSKKITHLRFSDFPELLRPRELAVLNDTKVIPARIRLGSAEILLVEQVDPTMWRCLVRPGKAFQAGQKFSMHDYACEVLEIGAEGERCIRFNRPLQLDAIGEIPLPPYIGRAPEPIDHERYQTVFASRMGAIAAPTAGLHFSRELLEKVPHVFLTLHVGVGTFRPVKTENIAEHHLHREEFEVTSRSAAQIRAAKEVLAVGTTTVRTLETLMQRFGDIRAGKGITNIFIYPPFQFRRVDSLLTNFHLPKSTLLMLVAAFAGREFVLKAYAEAIRERYRFFSYGDCMLIR
jgi:S-adenosylmethionine:tRNA ribosyltransferase-isomerase